MVDFLKFHPHTSSDWIKTILEISEKSPWCLDRVRTSFLKSQMESKLWLIEELIKVASPKRVALLGGWYAHIITNLLIETAGVEFVKNFEIDEDAKRLSYKFNQEYINRGQFAAEICNVMFSKIYLSPDLDFDIIINTSCEHMFNMSRFRELNPKYKHTLLVLQSTSENIYIDHINCVRDGFHLAEQANITDIKYIGLKKLCNGMARYMVIGR